jgi:hypothetical protein
VKFRTFIFLAFCLLWVALQPSPTTRNEVRSMSVGQPQLWDSLPAAVDSQTWWYATLPEPTTTTVTPLRRSGTAGSASRRSSSSTAECIGQRENGGDYGRSSNPTHFGKYQYDRQTWAAHGGNPDDWGTASPEEQERVFANGTAQYGYSAWTKYDGC